MNKRSLVLVTVDCLRADHVGFLGYPRAVTPTLDALARESVTFSNAIVTGAPTYFSFPGIFASRHPLSLGRDVLGIAPDEPTLATAMQQSGYRTAAFVAANPYLTARFGYDQGFDEFQDFMQVPTDQETGTDSTAKPASELNRVLDSISHSTRVSGAAYDELYFWYCQWRSAVEKSFDELRRYPAADVIVERASSWLNHLDGDPFFIWIHLMDPHHPYYPPQDALSSVGAAAIDARRARFLNSFWNRGDIGPNRLKKYLPEILSLYDAGISWADKQIGRLISSLQNSGRWNDTIFVATADHGEEFLEHGARYHSPANLPEQLLRVPLLIRAPETSQKGTIEDSFSLVHLAPTLLQALSLESPPDFQGQPCWHALMQGTYASQGAVSECLDSCNNPFHLDERMRSRLLAVRDGRYKLVIRFADATDQLYDLGSDPGEKSPLPDSVAREQRKHLLGIARTHLAKAERSKSVEITVRARVRELQHSNFRDKELPLPLPGVSER